MIGCQKESRIRSRVHTQLSLVKGERKPRRKLVPNTIHTDAAPAAHRGVSAPAALAAAAARLSAKTHRLTSGPQRRGQRAADRLRSTRAQRGGRSPLRVPRPAGSVPPRNAQARAAAAGSAQMPARGRVLGACRAELASTRPSSVPLSKTRACVCG
eukprot:scaffold15623_cov65-Phaeocystis_antarctica.AAC.2